MPFIYVVRHGETDANVKEKVNDKNVITCTVAICMVQQPLLAGLVFIGKTNRSLPAVDAHLTVHMTFTENHLQITQSLNQFLGFLDAHINADSPEQPWICFMDGASIHTSFETRQAIREKYPWLTIAFTRAGTTDFTQPLDRAAMRSFKASIVRRVSEHFARQVINLMEQDLALERNVRM